MLKRSVCLLLFGLCAIATLCACGENSLGGGIGEFTTVNATATASTLRLESDVLTGNTCTAGVSDAEGTYSTDYVDVDFTSTALFTSGALTLHISSITVEFEPIGAAPALAPYSTPVTVNVAPGTTQTLSSVAVLPESYKKNLFERATQNVQACGGNIFEYNVTILFEVTEPGGDSKVRNIPAQLKVAIADRV